MFSDHSRQWPRKADDIEATRTVDCDKVWRNRQSVRRQIKRIEPRVTSIQKSCFIVLIGHIKVCDLTINLAVIGT